MSDVHFDYSGQTIVLTGGSRGIGFAIGSAFAASGADLRVLANDPGVLDAAAAMAALGKGEVSGRVCDIRDTEAVSEALADLPEIDVLIANAGLELMTPVDADDEEADARFGAIIDTNVVGTYNTVRKALPRMKAGGRILLTSSVWGKSAVGGFSAYIASKHANIGFMRTLARELGPRRIRVNCVCPGWVGTDAAFASLAKMSLYENRPEEEILGEVMASQCIPGLQKPEEIAGLYLFLASSLAANITGQAINIDRGEFLG